MRRNKALLFFAIILTPFLMSNAPSPYPYPVQYEDYVATPVTIQQEESYYVYKTEITNEGEGYINLSSSYLDIETSYIPYDHPRKTIILPGETSEVTFVAKSAYDITDYDLRINAFVDIVEKTTFSNVHNFERRLIDDYEHEYWGPRYEYKFDVDYVPNEEYHHELIVTYKYENEFYTQYMHVSNSKVYFEDTLELDFAEIEFLDFYNVLGRKHNSGLSGIYLLLAFYSVVLIIVAIIATISVPVGITFLTVYLIKKKRAREEETKQER